MSLFKRDRKPAREPLPLPVRRPRDVVEAEWREARDRFINDGDIDAFRVDVERWYGAQDAWPFVLAAVDLAFRVAEAFTQRAIHEREIAS